MKGARLGKCVRNVVVKFGLTIRAEWHRGERAGSQHRRVAGSAISTVDRPPEVVETRFQCDSDDKSDVCEVGAAGYNRELDVSISLLSGGWCNAGIERLCRGEGAGPASGSCRSTSAVCWLSDCGPALAEGALAHAAIAKVPSPAEMK